MHGVLPLSIAAGLALLALACAASHREPTAVGTAGREPEARPQAQGPAPDESPHAPTESPLAPEDGTPAVADLECPHESTLPDEHPRQVGAVKTHVRLRLEEDRRVWMKVLSRSHHNDDAAGLLKIAAGCDEEPLAIGETIAIDLEAGDYRVSAEEIAASWRDQDTKEPYALSFLWDLQAPGVETCPAHVLARDLPLAGVEAEPGAWEQPPQPSNLGDINGDGVDDWSYVYVMNHNQLGTLISVSEPYPGCARAVRDGLGKATVVPTKGSWPSFNVTSYTLHPSDDPKMGGRVFIHQVIDYDAGTGSYTKQRYTGCSESGFMKKRVRSCEQALGI